MASRAGTDYGIVFAVSLAFFAGCNTGAPQRDVFIPPYAEKGCWTRLYEQSGFAGAMRTLEGPIFVEALGATPVLVPGIEKIPPQPLFSEMRSLEIGPHARIVAYAQSLFREPVLQLAPGTRVPELAAVRFHDRVQSFKMDCVA